MSMAEALCTHLIEARGVCCAAHVLDDPFEIELGQARIADRERKAALLQHGYGPKVNPRQVTDRPCIICNRIYLQ